MTEENAASSDLTKMIRDQWEGMGYWKKKRTLLMFRQIAKRVPGVSGKDIEDFIQSLTQE